MAFKPIQFPTTRGAAFISFAGATDSNTAAANLSSRACEEHGIKAGQFLEFEHDRSAQVFIFRIVDTPTPYSVPVTKRSKTNAGFAATKLIELDERLKNVGRIQLTKVEHNGKDWISFTAAKPKK